MDSDRFARLKELLLKVADLSEAELEAYLNAACEDDPELRKEAESILAHDADPSGILKTGGARSGGALDPPPSGEDVETIDPFASPGRTLGPYVLRERIGSGGMGEVWRAEQTTPVRRAVALKLIRAGMDSRQVIARFEAERQALAMMDHPYIAKVFDAGITEHGRPYFVMEHVPGVPITDYCDQHRLDTNERLELFEKVCAGVQHAHRKAVIHRDIKPSNILVADVDGGPLPKIIDFGVAKATARKLTDKTLHTALGQIIGTPEYMSPEQADLTCEDVDTRADVYSLGVVLYELLAGGLPFEPEELRRAGLEGILRLLREKDPPRPSTKISTLGEKREKIAERRRTDPQHLANRLKGDLDWIVMRALEKDRNRRYGSPQELAQDLQRHLGDEPVSAGPPGVRYRAGKFVKRHRIGVALAVAAFVAVAAAFVLVTVQNARVAAARDEAVLVTSTFQEMLASVDPKRSGPDVSVRELLDETAKTLGEKLKSQPLVEATLRHTIGESYRSLGDYNAAAEQFAIAVNKRRARLGVEDPRTLEAMRDLTGAYLSQGLIPDADTLAQETMEAALRAFGKEHRVSLAAQHTMALIYVYQNRYEEAEAFLLELLDVARRTLGAEDPVTIRIMGTLSPTYDGLRRYEDRLAIEEELLAIHRRSLGEEHPTTLSTKFGIAGSYAWMGRLDEARTLYQECLEAGRGIYGEEHPFTLGARRGVAETYNSQGRYGEAEPLLQENLEIARRVLGPVHGTTLASVHSLRRTYVGLERYDEAEALLQETLEHVRQAHGLEHVYAQNLMYILSNVYLMHRRHEKADSLYRKTLEMHERIFGERELRTSDVRYGLACSFALQGRRQEAVSQLQDIMKLNPEFFKTSPILDDPDLESVRGDPVFDAIVEELREKNEVGTEAPPE